MLISYSRMSYIVTSVVFADVGIGILIIHHSLGCTYAILYYVYNYIVCYYMSYYDMYFIIVNIDHDQMNCA